MTDGHATSGSIEEEEGSENQTVFVFQLIQAEAELNDQPQLGLREDVDDA